MAYSPYPTFGTPLTGPTSRPAGTSAGFTQIKLPTTNQNPTTWDNRSGTSNLAWGQQFGAPNSAQATNQPDLSSIFSTGQITPSMTMAGAGQTGGASGTNWWDDWPTGPSGPSGSTGQSPLDNQINVPTPNTTPGQTPGSPATGGGTAGFTWEVPQWMRGLTPEQWATPTMQQAVANYMAGSLPFTQLQQNSYQYTNDFNEAQRRYWDQAGWTKQTDQFNMDLTQQQQNLAKWMAEQQQGNWQQQFGLDSQVARDTLFNNARRDEWNYNLGVGALEVDRARNINQDWYNRQQVGIAQEQNKIDQMWKSGQLSNQQRDLALQELTQQQLNTYRNAQLSQEGALTREGYANQQAIARMQAFGRTQTPRARWVRSW